MGAAGKALRLLEYRCRKREILDEFGPSNPETAWTQASSGLLALIDPGLAYSKCNKEHARIMPDSALQ